MNTEQFLTSPWKIWAVNLTQCPLTQFQKICKFEPMKEPESSCKQWYSSLNFSDFQRKRAGNSVIFDKRYIGTGTKKIFGRFQICSSRLRKSWLSQVKNLRPVTLKNLAGILWSLMTWLISWVTYWLELVSFHANDKFPKLSCHWK